MRQEALLLLVNALEGSGGSGAFAAYSEAFRIIVRVGVSDKSFIVRLAAARCLKTFASIGGPGLGISELENSIYCCVKVSLSFPRHYSIFLFLLFCFLVFRLNCFAALLFGL